MAKKLGQRKKQKTAKLSDLGFGALADLGIHAYVATPAYNGRVDTDFCISLAESVQVATVLGINVTCGVMGNGAFIEIARNNFVKMFLESNATHLFFIDSDLKWEPYAFISLLQANLPIAAGVYRRREKVEDYPVRYVEAEGGGLQVTDEGWVECNRVPAGFLCIRRDTIEKMVEAAPEVVVAKNGTIPWVFGTEVGEHFLGEDFYFCDKYCELFEANIPVWPDFDFVHGGYECNYHKFLNKLIEAEDEGKEVTKEDFTVYVDGEVLKDGE